MGSVENAMAASLPTVRVMFDGDTPARELNPSTAVAVKVPLFRSKYG